MLPPPCQQGEEASNMLGVVRQASALVCLVQVCRVQETDVAHASSWV